MELSLLILVCIHKSYIVYFKIYVVLIGLGFHYLVMEKSWKINVVKEGAPWSCFHVLFCFVSSNLIVSTSCS